MAEEIEAGCARPTGGPVGEPEVSETEEKPSAVMPAHHLLTLSNFEKKLRETFNVEISGRGETIEVAFFFHWAEELNEIKEKFDRIHAKDKIILTTEKDAVRLLKFRDELATLPMYVLPIRHDFLFGEGEQFNRMVTDFIRNFRYKPIS